MSRLSLIVALCALLACLVTPVFAVDYVRALNIVDFGATPNSGVPDNDSTAIQNAINAACSGSTSCRSVYIPAGRYDLATTITLDSYKHSLRIVGDGAYDGRTAAPSILKWNPGVSGGTMINTTGLFGFRMQDVKLDGNSMADVLIKVNSENGCAAAQWNFERINMVHATKGFELGSVAPLMCDSDMTFIDLCMNYMTYGFNAMDMQNVDYVFIRPNFQNMSVALKFDQGGVVDCTQMTGAYVGTVLQVGASGSESYFNFYGVKMETQVYSGKRTQIVNAPTGFDCAFNFDGLWVTTLGLEESQPYTPLFNVGKGATLNVRGSRLCSNVLATMASTGSNMATSATFDGCIFQGAGDPRTTITRDSGCQVAMRNCKYYSDGMIPDYTLLSDKVIVCYAPAGLTVTGSTAGSTKMELNWTAIAGVQGYRVERSPNGTTGWQEIAVAPTNYYQDSGLTANTTYYYRVRAYSSSLLSSYSSTVSGKTYPNLYITSPANGEVASTLNPTTWTINAGTDRAINSVTFYIDGASYSTDNSAPYSATWSGGTLTAGKHTLYCTSTDGSTVVTSDSISVYVWTTSDIGAPTAGNASLASGVFTLQGAGFGIGGTSESFRYVHMPLSGNFTLIARAAMVPTTDDWWAMAGLMMRDGTATNAKMAVIGETYQYGYNFKVRTSAGADTGNGTLTGTALWNPGWLKLVRSGSNFSGYYSADGVLWTQLGATTSITMTDPIKVGMVVTPGYNGALGVLCVPPAKFDNVRITSP